MLGVKRKKALVLYHTRTGHTADAAKAVARGLESRRVRTKVKRINEVNPDELAEYSILAVGSPTRGARPARAVKRFLKGLERKALKGKTAASFSPYAGFRGKATVRRLGRLLRKRKAKVLRGVAVKAGAPLSLWEGPDIGEKGVLRLEERGRKVGRKG